MKALDISDFASTQLELLDRELQAELAETAALTSQFSPTLLQRAGQAISNLQVSSQRTGLGGRTVVDLELDPAVGAGGLPEHGIRVGDLVSLQEQPAGSAKKREKGEITKKSIDGTVVKVTPAAVAVALDKEDVDVPTGKLWLTKLANYVTYKRMNQTMTKLQRLTEPEQTPFMRVLFGQASPSPVPADLESSAHRLAEIEWFDPSLNDSQKEAIKFAIASREVALIHGPPGTGKTHTLIELILQLLKQKQRVLVCGPSNISVDNIVERLASSRQKVRLIRLGHPARLLPSVVNHSLDVLTRTSEAAGIVQDVRKEMDSKQASIRKTRSGAERRAIYGDLRELRKEYRERERNCVENLVRGSDVVLATLHGSGDFKLRHEQFDVVIIDEASQALEAQCWVPLISAKKLVLAGDHLQLPPTIKSLNSKTKAPTVGNGTNKAVSTTLETTLFDRLLALHGPSIKRMLTVQYRMHETIMTFPSQELYEGKLMAADEVKTRLLKDVPYGVEDTEDTSEALVFYDTQGEDFPERSENDETGKKPGKGISLSESKSNEGEATLCKAHTTKLIEAGVRAEDIAIITPYNAQVALISQLLKETFHGIEVGSVDGFQGREKEAIIVSLVRSNAEHEVGFLDDRRRMNVAMTRPKRHLCIIGDSETVGRGNKFLKKWMDFLGEKADLRYPNVVDVANGR